MFCLILTAINVEPEKTQTKPRNTYVLDILYGGQDESLRHICRVRVKRSLSGTSVTSKPIFVKSKPQTFLDCIDEQQAKELIVLASNT